MFKYVQMYSYLRMLKTRKKKFSKILHKCQYGDFLKVTFLSYLKLIIAINRGQRKLSQKLHIRFYSTFPSVCSLCIPVYKERYNHIYTCAIILKQIPIKFVYFLCL